MFERLARRAGALAERRARQRTAELAERIGAAGIRAQAEEDGVRLEGRGLRRRFALEPTLRDLVEDLR